MTAPEIPNGTELAKGVTADETSRTVTVQHGGRHLLTLVLVVLVTVPLSVLLFLGGEILGGSIAFAVGAALIAGSVFKSPAWAQFTPEGITQNPVFKFQEPKTFGWDELDAFGVRVQREIQKDNNSRSSSSRGSLGSRSRSGSSISIGGVGVNVGGNVGGVGINQQRYTYRWMLVGVSDHRLTFKFSCGKHMQQSRDVASTVVAAVYLLGIVPKNVHVVAMPDTTHGSGTGETSSLSGVPPTEQAHGKGLQHVEKLKSQIEVYEPHNRGGISF